MVYLPNVVTESSVTVTINNRPKVVGSDHPSFKAIVNAIRAEDWDEVEQLIDVATAINKFGDGKVVVVNGEVLYNGVAMANVLVDRILKMMNEGFNINPMLKFVENLEGNPSKSARSELYLFLEANAIPLTEDGYFLAYKKVNSSYMDTHSGKFDNSVGRVVEMDRRDVDDDRRRTCSTGLHFCSFDYLKHYGWSNDCKVMVVKINPSDVVAIPNDYDNAKGRTWKYAVVGEVEDYSKEHFEHSVYSSSGDVSDFRNDDLYSVDPGDPTGSMARDRAYQAGYNAGYDLDGYNYTYSMSDEVAGEYDRGYSDGYDDRGSDDISF
jgi:hypothetical protein